jgi:hypothetical protein
VLPKKGSLSTVGDKKTRRWIPLGSATLTIVGSVIAFKLTQALSGSPSLPIVGAWMAAGIIVTYLLSRLQARSQEESPEAIKERLSQLEPELRKQVQIRSYGARRSLIEAPLRELDLDVTPRLEWVRDPRLEGPKPVSKEIADDVVAAFESSKRRLLIVGEPGSGKTMAAYSLIEYLAEAEGAEGRIPLLVNLSAWEAQDDFETFLVDYLCSSVGYEVHERAVARAFIDSDRYSLILDGLDEIPVSLRGHFAERLDEFVRGLSGEVGVVVTCRTQEYEELVGSHSTGLGLVQAVEILHLTDRQLDSAFVELTNRDKDWETFLLQRHYTAYQRVRHLMSNPLFLNLAVVGHLSPDQLLDATTTERDLQDLVLETYLDRTLADQEQYEPEDARRYLSWIARFLNGDEVSPFGLKTSDYTVLDLADLTPPDPPRRYRLFMALGAGLIGMVVGMLQSLFHGELFPLYVGMLKVLGVWLLDGLEWGIYFGLIVGVLAGWPFKRSAVSTRLTLVWPSTRQRLRDFLSRAGLGLVRGLLFGLVWALILGLTAFTVKLLTQLVLQSDSPLGSFLADTLIAMLVAGPVTGLTIGLVWGLVSGLIEPRSVLVTSRTPKEVRSRSLIAALVWLVAGVLAFGVVTAPVLQLISLQLISSTGPLTWGFLIDGLVIGLILGLGWGLRNGGGFVLLQKVVHARTTFWIGVSRDRFFAGWGAESAFATTSSSNI